MNNKLIWKRYLSLTIIAALAFLMVVIPVSHIEAATVADGMNTGQNVNNPTEEFSNNLDAGWVYTANATYTLQRIEAKFQSGNGVAITVEFYSAPPSLGGTLLASGSFTPQATAPAGTVWEGVTLNTTVPIVSGISYFVGFRNIISVPSTDAAGVTPQLYYSGLSNDYSSVATGPESAASKPIVRFLTGDAPTITSTAPAGGTDGTSYSHTYTATGDTPITYSFTGTLPPGLTLTSAGVLSGTPNTPGTFTGSVTATNGYPPDATQPFSITIAGVAPAITSTAPAGGTDGTSYSHTYTATGSATITYSFTGTLPPGLTLTSAGVLSGTPNTPGTFTGSVTASNGYSPNATQPFSITIAAVAPTITSTAPAGGTQGTSYTHTYTATGSATITYSFTGTLPPGLTLTSAGVLSGTPNTPGTFTGTVTATNGVNPDASQPFSITIAGVAPTITSTAPAGGTDGTAYSHTYTATGSATITYSFTGTLPPGLTLTSAGVLSGTPNTPGTFTGSVTATNGVNPDASQPFSITIAAVAPTITSSAPPDGAESVSYTHTYTATGSATITYSFTGTLPPGLTLTSAGVLSGTPNTAGTFTGTVTATNGVNPDASQPFSITITAAGVPPTITSSAPPGGAEGVSYTHTYTATGTATITYSFTGTLPPGLTLTSAGVLSGTPNTAGTFTGSVTATNSFAPDATQPFSITITAASAITISPTTLPNGMVGTAYAQNLSAAGGSAPYTFNVTAGALPNGLTLTSGGVLSGTPTTAATFNFTVTATDSLSVTGSQAYTVVIGTTVVPTPAPVVEVQLPEPPPAPTCSDTNFEGDGMIRTNFTNDADRAGLSCRLMAANGSYMTWLGGPITNSGMIGDQSILDLGVVAAVDVFSASAASGFVGDVNICLKGSGYMIYFNASGSPRVPQLWSAWTTPAFPGYTCTTLYAPGTVVMVTNKP